MKDEASPVPRAVAPSNPPPRASVVPEAVPATLTQRGAGPFWGAVILTGIGAGCAAAALTLLLALVQHMAWPGQASIIDAATQASVWRHLCVLVGAGLLTGAGQILLGRLSSGNGIDISSAIWFAAGRMPALRTLGSALLSILIVGMGASLGREGAPKQAAAVIANALSDVGRLSDEQRRLLVACGAGAGMSAAYGVPIGGALFALEVLRGTLALRLILPALVTSLVATGVSWFFLPNAPTYSIPEYPSSASIMLWAVFAGPIAGCVSVAYVRAVAWADQNRPEGWRRLIAPAFVLGLLGVVAIRFPQLLGNGRDVSALAFTGHVAPFLLLALLFLRPIATVFCIRSGAPGGLFTPSLTLGALLGGVLGFGWSLIWPGEPMGAFAVVGAAAVLAATTQGPISAVVLVWELTGHDRPLIIPLVLAIATATLISRTIEPRSIYDARLSDSQIKARLAARDAPVR